MIGKHVSTLQCQSQGSSKGRTLLVLSSNDVEVVTETFLPLDLQTLMAKVFYCLSHKSLGLEGTIFTPHRTKIPMPHHTALFMPARIDRPPLLTGTSMKVVSVPSSSDNTRGLPASTIIMDEETGSVKAFVNARSLTALRNAAGSLLSSNIVGLRDPTSIVAFGAGKQIESHLDLHIRHFPSITSCTIINRTLNARVTLLRDRLSSCFPHVTFTYLASSEAAQDDAKISLDDLRRPQAQMKARVQSAHIIICATSSTAPLFPPSWVRNGTHVILIGSYTPHMREVDRQLVQRAINSGWRNHWTDHLGLRRPDSDTASPSPAQTNDSTFSPGSQCTQCIRQILMVDSREACAIEAGELIDAGVADNSGQVAEIGELVYSNELGDIQLKTFDECASVEIDKEGFNGPITMFKSVGVGLQDVAIACAVVEKAGQMGVGVTVQDYDG